MSLSYVKKAVFLLGILSLLSQSAHAKPFYKNWKWWVGGAAQGAAIILDATSTARVEYVCSGCAETNPMLPARPSTGVLIGYGFADWAGEMGLHALAYHLSGAGDKRTRWPWKVLGYAEMPAVSGGAHGYAAAHNYALANRVYQIDPKT